MKVVQRKKYLNELIDLIGTPDIKVITGVRRAGKSFLLNAFKEYIESNIDKGNIIYINYNLDNFIEIKTQKELIKYIKDNTKISCKNFILIDEVQMCEGFEKAIISLYTEMKYDIYITGSNAFLMSNDLATLFTGRTFSIEVFPFSFSEYCEYYNVQDKYTAFEKYIKEGGLAGTYIYKNEKQKYDYINELFYVLILRDVLQKYKIRHSNLFKLLIEFLVDNISNLTSANKIAEHFIKNNEKINHKTIDSYLDYLCNAFAFYKIKRYDLKGKKYLSSINKYYLCDHSIRYALLGTKNLDRGRILENIVAIDLLRKGYEVYVGVLYNKEIDFVAINRDKKLYIQVSDNIDNDETLKRELNPFYSIKDGYSKILIANTKQEKYTIDGIEVYDFSEWLS